MWSGLSFLAATEAGETFRRTMRAAVAACIALVAGIMGFVFALMALHGWLGQRMTSIEASLIISAGLIFIALVCLIIAGFIRRSRKAPSALASSAIVAAPMALQLIGRRLDFKAIGIIGVLAAGAIVGRQISRMRF